MKLTLLLVVLALAFTTDAWQPFTLDERVSVELPGKPEELDASRLNQAGSNHVTRAFQLIGEEGVYTILRATNAVPSATLSAAERDSFYVRGVRDAFRTRKGVILSHTTFNTPAGAGVEYKTRTLSPAAHRFVTRYSRTLLVGATAYTFGFSVLNKTDTTSSSNSELSRRFFNSITVKP